MAPFRIRWLLCSATKFLLEAGMFGDGSPEAVLCCPNPELSAKIALGVNLGRLSMVWLVVRGQITAGKGSNDAFALTIPVSFASRRALSGEGNSLMCLVDLSLISSMHCPDNRPDSSFSERASPDISAEQFGPPAHKGSSMLPSFWIN